MDFESPSRLVAARAAVRKQYADGVVRGHILPSPAVAMLSPWRGISAIPTWTETVAANGVVREKREARLGRVVADETQRLQNEHGGSGVQLRSAQVRSAPWSGHSASPAQKYAEQQRDFSPHRGISAQCAAVALLQAQDLRRTYTGQPDMLQINPHAQRQIEGSDEHCRATDGCIGWSRLSRDL